MARTKYEESAIASFKSMWKNWGQFNSTSFEESISILSDSCKGFGSGYKEYWKNKRAFIKYCESSTPINSSGFGVVFKWVETAHLSKRIVSLCGELSLEMELPMKKIILDPLRFTGVFKEKKGAMKLKQWHISRPDASMEEEMWEGTGVPRNYQNVSILFTDFVGFSKQVSQIEPRKLVEELNEIFATFDMISRQFGLEKIKTIGDAYMAVKGLKEETDHAHSIIRAAVEMLSYLQKRNSKGNVHWDMRIGVHSGPVVGGTIGSEKIGFDLWGDTVNIASRVESKSEANQINISSATYELIKDKFDCEYRGFIEVKGNREIEMYFVMRS